jgi:hypothetical protein
MAGFRETGTNRCKATSAEADESAADLDKSTP